MEGRYTLYAPPAYGHFELKNSSPTLNYLHLFTLGAFAIAQPLLDLLGRNAEFFSARQSEPLDMVLLALAVLLAPLPLALAEFICGLISPRLQRVIHVLLVIVLTALIALPLLKAGIDFPAPAVIGTSIGIAVLFTLFYSKHSAVYRLVSWLAVAIMLFPLYFLVLSPASALVFPNTKPTEQLAVHSPSNNQLPVILIVLDELPLSSLMTTDQKIDAYRYPNFARLAESSTWYRNATTVAAGTLRSLPAILTGTLPTKTNRLATYEEFPVNAFTLFGTNHKLNIFESVTSLCPENLCVSDPVPTLDRVISLLTDAALVYPHIIMPASVVEGLPNISQNWGNFLADEGAPSDDASGKVRWLQDIVGPWQTSTDSPTRFREFGASITTEPALNFIHLLLPHVPFRYLPSGKRYKNGLWARHPDTGKKNDKWVHEWSAARSFQQSLLQLAYMDRLLGEFLDTLESTGVFDDAFIVLVSDHGASYRPGTKRRTLTRENARDLLPIIMLVKEPNQREGVISDRNVETIDIVPTLAQVIGAAIPDGVDGQSMLNNSLPERDHKSAYSKILKALISFDASIKEKVEATHYKAQLLGQREDPIVLYGPGLRSDLLGKPTTKISSVDIKVNLDYSRHYEDIDLDDETLPVRVTGRIKSPSDPTHPFDIAVSVNGTIAAVGKTYPIDGNAEFSVLVPEAALRAGKNEVTAFVPTAESD